jgi:hypothetical protein
MKYSPMLIFHIYAGTAGLLSGALAMVLRKGSLGHRVAGDVFAMSMLGMSAAGTYMALLKSQFGNIMGGTLTFYMVATAWATARRDRKPGTLEWIGAVVALGVGMWLVITGTQLALSGMASRAGVPTPVYFFVGSVGLLSGTGDVRMLRGALSGTQRLVRHLWRMCFALFVATGSVFIARPHLFPKFMSTTHILLVLGVSPLLAMIFWLIRVRFKGRHKRTPVPKIGGVYAVRA